MGPTQAHSTRTATRILALLAVIFLSIWMMSCGTSSNTTTTTPTPAPTPTPTPTPTPPPTGGGGGSSVAVTTETIVTGVSVPWSLVFAPDGRLFFTEQRGNLKIYNNGQVTTAYQVNTPGGLDGMTGLVLDPNFAMNHRLFVFYCVAGTPEHCMIDRLIENNGVATHEAFIFDFPTGNRDHIGGRMKIGPDGFLYLTTGDQQNNAQSQDPSSVAGKILRMDLDGNAQGGGGFANPYVFAMGFRDPEGLAWDASGNLYGSDHGPESNDEINLIQVGKNYRVANLHRSLQQSGVCRSREALDSGNRRAFGYDVLYRHGDSAMDGKSLRRLTGTRRQYVCTPRGSAGNQWIDRGQ